MNTKNIQKKKNITSQYSNEFNAYSFALNLGFRIAIPIVAFALGGRLLDRKYDSSPLWILIGIGISMIFTSFLIFKKSTDVINSLDNKKEVKKKKDK